MSEKQILGGFYAVNQGEQPGKMIECEVQSVPTRQGGSFLQVQFFRPYILKSENRYVRGGWLPMSKIPQLVERINWVVQHFGETKGHYQFVPAQGVQPSYGAPQQPVAPTPGQYAPPQQEQPMTAPQAPQYQPPQQPQQYAPQGAPQAPQYQPQGAPQYQPPQAPNPPAQQGLYAPPPQGPTGY